MKLLDNDRQKWELEISSSRKDIETLQEHIKKKEQEIAINQNLLEAYPRNRKAAVHEYKQALEEFSSLY